MMVPDFGLHLKNLKEYYKEISGSLDYKEQNNYKNMKDKKISGLITVRTSSSRLPTKCLLPFGEVNVIIHIINRAKFYGIDPIICTSVDPSDDILESIAKEMNVKCFRGSLINKLKRWADCVTFFGLDDFHTVDADDPFFDGEEISRSIDLLRDGGYDMVGPTESSSAGGASVGYSLTRDIITRAAVGLEENADTEMMWYYVERIPGLKSTKLPEEDKSRIKVRLTLDYQEDYWLLESMRRMIGNLATRKEVNDLFVRNPDLYLINWFRNQEWKEAQLAKKI
jgi:spore coat polysaccharide biosynthesis protein SpsF